MTNPSSMPIGRATLKGIYLTLLLSFCSPSEGLWCPPPRMPPPTSAINPRLNRVLPCPTWGGAYVGGASTSSYHYLPWGRPLHSGTYIYIYIYTYHRYIYIYIYMKIYSFALSLALSLSICIHVFLNRHTYLQCVMRWQNTLIEWWQSQLQNSQTNFLTERENLVHFLVLPRCWGLEKHQIGWVHLEVAEEQGTC